MFWVTVTVMQFTMYSVYVAVQERYLHRKLILVKDVTLTSQVQQLCTFSINHDRSRVTQALNTEYYAGPFLP